MPEPAAAETISKTIIRENRSSTPTPEQTMADSIIGKVDEGSFREGLELAKKTPISKSKIDQKVEQIGINRDADGKKDRTTEEKRRFDEATKSAKLAKDYIEKGYDNLTGPEKDGLRNRVLEELKSRPSLAEEMRHLTTAQKAQLAERILKDPRYTKEARQILENTLDSANFDETIITNAQYAVEDAQIDLDDKSADFTDAQTRLTNAKTQLALYERDATGAPATGATRATELDSLRNTSSTSSVDIAAQNQIISTNEREITKLERELAQTRTREGLRPLTTIDTAISNTTTERNNANTTMGDASSTDAQKLAARQEYNRLSIELSKLQAERDKVESMPPGRDSGTIEGEIDAAKSNISNARTEMQRIQSDLPKLSDKEKSEKELREDVKKLEEEKREKELAKKKAETELNRRKKNLADVMALRTGQEQDLVDNLGNVFESATGEWVNAQVEAATNEMNAQLEKLKATTNDNNEKAMYDAMRERWLGTQRTRRKGLIGFRSAERYRPIDRAQTNTDFGDLIANGPDNLARNILNGRNNPTTNVPYTPDEINALVANKEFMGKMQPEMIKQLLTRKHLTGGFSQEDIFVLEQSPWGKGMINEAINNVDKYKDVIESAFGAGVLNSHGFKDKFIQIARNNPLWMLLLIGLPVAAVGALTMQATAESIQQQY